MANTNERSFSDIVATITVSGRTRGGQRSPVLRHTKPFETPDGREKATVGHAPLYLDRG